MDWRSKIQSLIQFLFGCTIIILIFCTTNIVNQVGRGVLNEKRNIDLGRIDLGFKSRRNIGSMKTVTSFVSDVVDAALSGDDLTTQYTGTMNMADEYDRWFADLYQPSKLMASFAAIEHSTSTASYLGYGLEKKGEHERARSMFPDHLNVKPYHVMTVFATDLSEWQQRILEEAPDAFHDEKAETAKSAHGFGVAYPPDKAHPQVRRTVLRMTKSTVAPSTGTQATEAHYQANVTDDPMTLHNAFATFVGSTVVYRTKNITGSEYTDDMKSKTVAIKNITDADLKTNLKGRVPGTNHLLFGAKSTPENAPKYLVDEYEPKAMQYYFEHDETFDNIRTQEDGLAQLKKVLAGNNIADILTSHYFAVVNASGDDNTHYYSFESVHMYETPVPSCSTGEDKCKRCIRPDDQDPLSDTDETQCRANLELLMGLSGRNSLYLQQCNKDQRDTKPAIVWPMYAWTLNLLTLPATYLDKIVADETDVAKKEKILLAVQDDKGKAVVATGRTSLGSNMDTDSEINVRAMTLEQRREIVSGKTYVTLSDEKLRNVCLAEKTPSVVLSAMSQCVAKEDDFRVALRHGAVITLFIGVIIYMFFGLFCYGACFNIARINNWWNKKLRQGEEDKLFVLQWVTNTRLRSEFVAAAVDYGNEIYFGWKVADGVLLFFTVVLYVGLLIVLGFVSSFISEVGPTCSSSDTVTDTVTASLEMMYTTQGRADQLYVKDFVGIFFVVIGWIFFVFPVVGVIVNLVELRMGRGLLSASSDTKTSGGGAPVYMQVGTNIP